MSFIVNQKNIPIPSSEETKIKILSMAQMKGCYPETIKLYKKYEEYYKRYQFDELAKFEMAKGLIRDLAKIDIFLVAWLADEEGAIRVNNKIIFTIEDDGKK